MSCHTPGILELKFEVIVRMTVADMLILLNLNTFQIILIM